MRLVLASVSARRRLLLEQQGLDFEIKPAHVDETILSEETPGATVVRLARSKATEISARVPDAVVLGADTLVCLGETVLGKPVNMDQARDMLLTLSGKSHRVLTGVALVRRAPPREAAWVCSSRVLFKAYGRDTVEDYLGRVYTLDKAGGYAVQEEGHLLVDRVEGLVSNVIGLPVEQVMEELDAFREFPPTSVSE